MESSSNGAIDHGYRTNGVVGLVVTRYCLGSAQPTRCSFNDAQRDSSQP
ncbi:hypothetical protein ALQ89_200074 [Pseudomonas amygdali pv. tabaci]|uniref:Uncharacterized protein n=1 Tax=Pseudomonas amygdali pv. tabaci TaxID=322 RepID=A0AAX1VZH5_PSEAJ|nr:hypothetical protein ALQ89_200074 [Pseudomonas amygdali pv. tabaci]